jgi:hypothetical protein
MDSIGPIVTLVLSIVGVLLKCWQDNKPARQEEQKDEETEKDREAIASGNVVAVNAIVDSLSTKTTGDPSGLPNDKDTARDIAAITGL